jgi:hypothetical protein
VRNPHHGLWRARGAIAASLAALLALPGMTAAAAATARAPKPAVVTLRTSKAGLTSAGGVITVTATVRHATKCTFSSRPALRGLPAKVSCSRGRAARNLRLPGNAGTAAESYRLALTAAGSGGTSKPRYATVRVLPAAPAVTLSASPGGLTKDGGTATLTATVRGATSCELSASPAVTGLPASLPCADTGKTAAITHTVTLPALTGTQAQPYSFTVKAAGPGGGATSTASETVWPALTFSSPAPADPAEGLPGSLSCAGPSDCVAADMFGNVSDWNGSSWSAPQHVLALPPGLATGMLDSVSCPATSFCAVVSQAGGMAVNTDGTWSAGPSTGVGATDLSCADASLCAAIGGDYASVYTGAGWSAPVLVTGSSDSLESVSCPAGTTFCLATDYDGNAYTFDGSGWSAATSFDSSTDPSPVVSCATEDFCVAVDGSVDGATGDAYTYNGISWSSAVEVSSQYGLSSVSCPASGFCMALDTKGEMYTLQGGAWSGAVGAGHYEVSCSSSSFCALLGTYSEVSMESGSTWTSAYTSLQHVGLPTSVSCPTPSYCAAVDQTGSVAVFNGKRWSIQQAAITAGAALVSVSCTSPTFCMAVDNAQTDDGSDAYLWNGKVWSGAPLPGLYLTSVSCTSARFCMLLGTLNGGVYATYWYGSEFSAPAEVDATPADGQVSCASPDFCAAVDANGNAMTFDGTSWSSPDPIDPGVDEPLATVSCPTSSFCTAMDGFGQAFTYTAAGWSKAAGVENSAGVTSVSCTSASFCVAADLTGNVVTYYDGTWSAPQNIDPQSNSDFYGFTGISCASVAFCAAVDYEGNASIGTG